jgi:hypothetical protein
MVTNNAKGWGAVLLVSLEMACATHRADTPENAFNGYTFAALRNRKEMLKKFATPEHIQGMEAVFDLSVVSAAWPANVTILRSLTRKENAVVVAQGIGREKEALSGTFYLAQQKDKSWKVVQGDWSGYAPENLEDAMDMREGIGKYALPDENDFDSGITFSETGEPMMSVN